MKSNFGTPPHHVCEICNDDGLCRNNIFSTKYDIDFSDYLDCMNYIKSKNKLKTKVLGVLNDVVLLKEKPNTLTKIRK
jgi:hypothetical protein|tara:strand:+ start:181 stop:414 length:234 start_codon:yes stop_codon:yes gene_type:complete